MSTSSPTAWRLKQQRCWAAAAHMGSTWQLRVVLSACFRHLGGLAAVSRTREVWHCSARWGLKHTSPSSATDLLHDIGCISQPARDRVCLQKASVFRTVSFGTSYPPLCLQNCFSPKQARSAPCCLNLSPFCLDWKIPLFLGGACCKTVGDIC